MRPVQGVLAVLFFVVISPAASAFAEEFTVEEVVERYVDARGGAETWREIEALELRGTFSVISKRNPFRLVRQRGDLYRMDYTLADLPAVKARDAEGPWMLNAWLSPEVGRVAEDPYKRQLEREALFPLLLLDYEGRGIEVELLGPGEIEGIETLNLRLTLPDGQQETWYLDSQTYLEVAADSQIYDFTQAREPIRQRIFFDDFREVDGVVLPFLIDWEFNARLESMTVEEIVINPEIEPGYFSPPAAAPAN